MKFISQQLIFVLLCLFTETSISVYCNVTLLIQATSVYCIKETLPTTMPGLKTDLFWIFELLTIFGITRKTVISMHVSGTQDFTVKSKKHSVVKHDDIVFSKLLRAQTI